MSWKDEFIEKIGCVNISDLRIEEAQALKIKNMPKFLYKYRSDTDNAINNLETDTVWLNKPSEYNDPFEFVEYLDTKELYKVIGSLMKNELIDDLTKKHPVPEHVIEQAKKSDFPLKIISEYQLKNYEGMPDGFIQKFHQAADEVLQESTTKANVDKIKSIKDKMKVCSFCESPKQLLMWSHYANEHKGFCVEYNISKWEVTDVRNRVLFPVIYRDDFFDFTPHLISNIQSNNFNNIYTTISGATKSKEWEYEQEWRFIFAIGDSFPKQNYPMDCQTKVFLGSRMEEKSKNRVIDICKEKGLKVYNAIPSTSRYEVVFDEITFG